MNLSLAEKKLISQAKKKEDSRFAKLPGLVVGPLLCALSWKGAVSFFDWVIISPDAKVLGIFAVGIFGAGAAIQNIIGSRKNRLLLKLVAEVDEMQRRPIKSATANALDLT